MKLHEKVVLVTGGAGDIGAAIVERMAKEGANIVVADLNEESINKVVSTVESIGCKALGITVDVSKKNQVDKMVLDSMSEFGQIDILFNNAGVVMVHDFLDIEEQDWDRIIDINLKGVFV